MFLQSDVSPAVGGSGTADLLGGLLREPSFDVSYDTYIYIYMLPPPPHAPTLQHGFQTKTLRSATRGGF